MQVTRTRRRPWVWVLLVALVLLVNWAVSISFVLLADQRMTEIEQRIGLALQNGEKKWKGELATAQGELGRELSGRVAELRSELTELRREVGADEGNLRSVQEVVDALGGRVGRIESMVASLWRVPGNGARQSS